MPFAVHRRPERCLDHAAPPLTPLDHIADAGAPPPPGPRRHPPLRHYVPGFLPALHCPFPTAPVSLSLLLSSFCLAHALTATASSRARTRRSTRARRPRTTSPPRARSRSAATSTTSARTSRLDRAPPRLPRPPPRAFASSHARASPLLAVARPPSPASATSSGTAAPSPSLASPRPPRLGPPLAGVLAAGAHAAGCVRGQPRWASGTGTTPAPSARTRYGPCANDMGAHAPEHLILSINECKGLDNSLTRIGCKYLLCVCSYCYEKFV
nr:protein transport protein SEC31-like [Aegilops tauschii subsp. strangulata]